MWFLGVSLSKRGLEPCCPVGHLASHTGCLSDFKPNRIENIVAPSHWPDFKTQEPRAALGYRFGACGLQNIAVMQKVLLDSSVRESFAPEGVEGIIMTECLTLAFFPRYPPLSASFLQIEKGI